MSDNRRTAPSQQKKSSTPDEIVELRPPAGEGFSGTARFMAQENALLIEELKRRGYVVVEQEPA